MTDTQQLSGTFHRSISMANNGMFETLYIEILDNNTYLIT